MNSKGDLRVNNLPIIIFCEITVLKMRKRPTGEIFYMEVEQNYIMETVEDIYDIFVKKYA